MANIIYTYTDEAPALATHSLLPIMRRYADAADIAIDLWDISLAARILAVFPDALEADQRVQDALTDLGTLTQDPHANIIKLPNISASVPQMKAAIAELQSKGYALPDYPDDPATDDERDVAARYDRVKGSAVNPVLREGNSDRRAPAAVKKYAQAHPHRMGEWSPDSPSHVATMDGGDFRSSERSVTVSAATTARIEHVASDGTIRVLRDAIALTDGEVIDGAVMRRAALLEFLNEQIAEAREQGLLFSLHLKATMMKVSDPIIFGHAVRTFFADVFARYADELAQVGVNANDGLASLEAALTDLPDETRAAILADIQARYDAGPELAQVDSDRGITNLHVPSDVIVDASMPAMIRSSGKMWNRAGELQDAKAVIPDSSYASIYSETIEFCKRHGAFDPATMGSIPNVGLMAQKAEEYGSHDNTVEVDAPGTIRVVDADGATLLSHDVDTGDIWRLCQTRDTAIRDWVKLAVSRARATGTPAVFWLDADRAHDAQLIAKVEDELPRHDTEGLDIRILGLRAAIRLSLERAKAGQDTISVTGNVLRDYLTDLFPILELGTSAKMLSIVPLINGGAMFETGAGGSAPKHVQQLVKENHLRWDSLGEILAMAASFEHYASTHGHPRAQVLADTLDEATATLLERGKSPLRKVGELDTRGSHFYLALYWAQVLAHQSEDTGLATAFGPLASTLTEQESTIVEELQRVQGQPVDLAGYYWIDRDLADAAMRPSTTFNDALATLGSD